MMDNFTAKGTPRSAIFVTVSCLLAMSVFATVYFDQIWLLIIPLAIPPLMLVLYYAFRDFKMIFILLLLVFPFTKEFEVPGGLAIDLPGEPLIMILAAIAVVYTLVNPAYFKRLLRNPIASILLLHIAWVGIAVLYSTEPLISLKYLLSKLWYVIPCILLLPVFISSHHDFKKYFWLLIIPIAISILGVLYIHAQEDFSFEAINVSSALFFRNHVNYAAFISLFIPFIWLAGKWYDRSTVGKLLVFVMKIIFMVGIYFAFARGAWLALIGAVVFYYAMKYRKLKFIVIPLICGIIAFGIHLSTNKQYINYAPQFEKAIYHGNIIDHLKATIKNQDVSTAERFYRWVAASRMFVDHPVTGFGPGSFYHSYKGYTVSSFTTYVSDNPERSGVHNYFLMTLVEQGIVGVLLFIFLTFSIFYYGVKTFHQAIKREQKLFIAAILCSLVIIYVQLMLSDLVETFKIGSFFFINIGLLVRQMDLLSEKPGGE